MPIVDVPGLGEVEFPDGMSNEQMASAIRKRLNPSPEPKPPSAAKQWASAAIRPIAKGVAGLPLMAMDAGVGTRNFLTGENYELPSSMFNKALDAYTTAPEGWGSVAENVSAALVGSKLPAPQAATRAPAGFTLPTGTLTRDTVLKQSQQAGYSIPPSSNNPSPFNKALESVGGKVAMEQDASIKNQAVTNSLVKRALGMAQGDELSPDALSGIRGQAGQAYQAVRSAGTMSADQDYARALAGITAKYRGAANSFPGLAKNQVADAVQSVDVPQFDAGDAIDAISIVRDNANKAYASGDKSLGKAYKEIAAALEGLIERNLAQQGQPAAQVLKDFRDARQLIAKTYSVEGALNPATGGVTAAKLAGQLQKGKPLSGELRTVAQFGSAFPKAARQVLDSGSVRNTDIILGGGAAALSKEPNYLLYPFARQAIRAGLLSPAGQSLAFRGGAQVPKGLLMGLVPPWQQGSELFAQ